MREFDRIIGYDGIKRQLERTADILRNLDAYKAAGARTPAGLLIHGAPGLGKSLMAECLIEAAGLPAFTVRKDKSNGSFVDHVDRTFKDAATRAPSIVYLDDMDKFADADEQHRNAEEYVAVQSAIDSAKGKDVFVLATTNDMGCLPESLTRAGRFDRRINVSPPDGDESRRIIGHYLSGKRLADDLRWDDVAMLMSGRSCAELEAILNEALLVSVSRREDAVSRASFMEAYFEAGLQKTSSFGEGRFELTESSSEERGRIAVHEAGHAAVFEVLAGRSVSLATAFRKYDQGGGLCFSCKPDGCPQGLWSTIGILGGLGGRAATDLVFGVADEGSADDLNRAANRIRSRIEAGMEFGVPYPKSGFAESPSRLWRQEALVEAELARHFQKTKEVLAANRGFLDAMAEAIAGSEYLLSSDIQEIKDKCRTVAVPL